jgi:uncharacterized protein (DUF302 family)
MISFEILVLIAALFLYAYIAKQDLHKMYRYFAGTLALVMIVIIGMTALHGSGGGKHGCWHGDAYRGTCNHGHGHGKGDHKRHHDKPGHHDGDHMNKDAEPEAEESGSMEQSDNQMTTTTSPLAFDETVQKLQDVIGSKGLKVMNVIDHAGAAANAEMELQPTTVILFGNPKVGTLLMQQSQAIGIDLPLKLLISEDANGQVSISYTEIADIGGRHGIDQGHEVVKKVTGAMASIVSEATGA